LVLARTKKHNQRNYERKRLTWVYVTFQKKAKWLVLIFVLFLVSTTVSAWGCTTHQWICEQAGFGGLDCCEADGNVSPVFHHCADNAPDCKARIKAAELFNASPNFAAHLYADSLSPPHWYSFNESDYYSCHTRFEREVNDRVGLSNWTLGRSCGTRDGQVVYVEASDVYLAQVVAYVKASMANADAPIPVVSTFPSISASPSPSPAFIPSPTPTPKPSVSPTPTSTLSALPTTTPTAQPQKPAVNSEPFYVLFGIIVLLALAFLFLRSKKQSAKEKTRGR